MQIKKKCPWLTGIRNLATLSIILMVLSLSNTLNARNFYFSTSIGDDSRTVAQAQNPLTPWKTLNKLNSFFPSLLAGDSVLFKRGEVFDGKIIVTKSGTATAPIVLSAFGTGSKPVINGFTTLSGWTNLGGGIWQAAAPYCKASLNMVTLNDVPQAIGRYPNEGYLTFESANGTTSITDNQLASSPNWTGAEVVIRKTHWVIDRNVITNHTGTVITYSTGSDYPGLPGYGYFIQNDPKTLDKIGEWYFNPVNKNFQFYFGSGNPSLYLVKASKVDTLVYINNRSNIKYDNLSFQGANFASFLINNSQNITIQFCEILYSGTDAILASNTANLTCKNSLINHSNNDAFAIDTYGGTSVRTLVSDNIIKNSGLIPGMGGNGDGKNFALSIQSEKSIIQNNYVDSCGYLGIVFTGDSTVVKNNVVNHFCMVKDDGSGIYTYIETPSVIYYGRKVLNNIVLNGFGAPAGTSDMIPAASGIYLDGYTQNVLASGNTVSQCSLAGIYIGWYAKNLTIRENVLFNNLYQFKVDNKNTSTSNLTIRKNIFFTKSTNQQLFSFLSTVNNYQIGQLGSFDSNYYIHPYGDDAVVRMKYLIGGKQFSEAITYEGWKSYDLHARKDPISMPDYTLNSLVGSNKFSNGNFNTNILGAGIGYAGTATISWDNTGKLDGGCLKLTYTTLATSSNETNVKMGVGEVSSNKNYILRFSSLGTTANKAVNVHLRQPVSPYIYLAPIQYMGITTTRTDKELLFSSPVSQSSANLYFVFSDVNGTSYLDNVGFYEADVDITDPDSTILFAYNDTNINKVVPLDGTYVSADSTLYTTSITLLPYTSMVLLKSSDTTANVAPIIENQGFQLNENSPNGTVVGTVLANDPDAGQTLTYSILSGNTGNAFTINGSTGVLTVANSTALNYEVTPSFALVVKVQDNGTGNLSSQATVTVNLTNVNELPQIANQTFTIPENSANGTLVGTVVATDPDAGQTLNYSILSGNTSNAFAINATTGAVTVANTSALNYEVIPSFALVVKVKDNGTGNLSNQATVTVSLTNVNEIPVIANQSFSVPENSANGTLIGTVVATDPDAGQTLTYSILSGNASNAIAINASSGALTVANTTALNFEVTPSFTLVVKVKDNGTGNLSNQATMTVSLTNVNELPQIANQSFSVPENSANGTLVGTVLANDPDAGQTLTYSILSGNEDEAFVISSLTGTLTVANVLALNYEDTPLFSLVIKVQDNGSVNLSSQATITINIGDLNEAPLIANQTFSIDEDFPDGTWLGTVVATDPDFGQALTYSILSGNIGGAFSINESDGNLEIANSSMIDFERNTSFNLLIKVQDNGLIPLSNQRTITIHINDINEMPVVLDQYFTIMDNVPNGAFIGTVIASDPDEGQSLTWSIQSGNTDNTFSINPSNGVLYIVNTATLSNPDISIFQLTVYVQDNGMGNPISQALVTVNVLPTNDPPVIEDQAFFLNENSLVNTVAGTVAAYDPDQGQSITYSIMSGNTNEAFSIDPNTGVLTVANAASLNYEVTPVFDLVVQVQDNGENNLNSQAAVTIILINQNEPPLILNQQFAIPAGSPSGYIVGYVEAIDPDLGQSLSYSILSGNTGGAFSLNPSTGLLTVANSNMHNYLANPYFDLQISVHDNGAGNLSDQAITTINLFAPSMSVQHNTIAINSLLTNPVTENEKCSEQGQEAGESRGYSNRAIGEVQSSIIKDITIYPNPAFDRIFVTIPQYYEDVNYSVKIWDMSGKPVADMQQVRNNLLQVDINQYPRGIYLMEILIVNKRLYYRFVKG